MPFYSKQGKIPEKRHTVFNNSDGRKLYEELISREGFSSIYSNLYHINMPTSVLEVIDFVKHKILISDDKHTAKHFETFKYDVFDDAINSRLPILFNKDIIIGIANIDKSMDYFY